MGLIHNSLLHWLSIRLALNISTFALTINTRFHSVTFAQRMHILTGYLKLDANRTLMCELIEEGWFTNVCTDFEIAYVYIFKT